jgi:CHAT domain-containing protein/Tfp pilus assembly protein PilF
MKAFILKISLPSLFLFVFWEVQAQDYQQKLEDASSLFRLDSLSGALEVYKEVYKNGTANHRIQGLAGMLKIAIQRSEVSKADSLIKMGDALLKNEKVAERYKCKFLIIKGEYFRSNSQFDKALAIHKDVARRSSKLDSAELLYADALFYIGLTYERLVEYDSSLYYVDKAYAIYKKEMDPDDPKLTSVFNGLGVVYYRVNRFEESKKFYLKSKEIAEKNYGPYSSDLAVCLANLSSISRAEENYHEAIQFAEQSLKINRALGDKYGISSAYYSLGVYHYFLGDYGRTKDYMRECIGIREKLYAPTHYSLIGPYEVLGIAYEESGDYDQTLKNLRKARPIIRKNYGENSPIEAYNYENTALCFKSLGNLDSALHYIKLANQILPKKLQKNDPSLLIHYFSLATIYYEKEEWATSLLMLEKSNRIGEENGMANSTDFAQNLGLRAMIAVKLGDWAEAEEYFQKALKVVRIKGDGLNPDDYKMVPNSLWVINEYSNYLLDRYEKLGNKNDLDGFNTYSKLYLELSNKFRKQFVDPYTKSVLIKDNAEVFEDKIGTYQKLYAEKAEDQYLEKVYDFSENARATMLRDLQDDKIQSYAGIPDSVLEKEKLLRKELADLNSSWMDAPESDSIQKALFLKKEALNEFIQDSRKRYPRYYELKYEVNIPGLDSVQNSVDNEMVLLEYLSDHRNYFVLMISNDFRELIPLGSKAEILKEVIGWKESIVQLNSAANDLHSRNLYDLLWQPLEGKLNKNRIVIIPSGPLFYLNFETLRAPEGYLIQQFNISYALSIDLFLKKRKTNQNEGVMAIAPGFEDELKEAYTSKLDSIEQADRNYLYTVRQPWSVKLASRLGGSKSLVGSMASEANVKETIKNGNVIYFGTHAIANADDPLRSRLVLAKDMEGEDGYLHAYELFGLPVEADLAVLNACESGLGNIQKGEGMISLSYSLQFAGCPSTVMSLWKVDEKVSTQITESFFDFLADGKSKSEALRMAKLKYLENAKGDLVHPFYWGGLVLMGQDGMVEIETGKSSYLVFLMLGLVLVVVLYARKKKG